MLATASINRSRTSIWRLTETPPPFSRLDALAWAQVPVGWCTYDEGHGRREIRTIQVRPAPTGLKFPHEPSTAPPRFIRSPNRSTTQIRSPDSTSCATTDLAAPSRNTSMLPELGG
jgi:hypothetical protein